MERQSLRQRMSHERAALALVPFPTWLSIWGQRVLEKLPAAPRRARAPARVLSERCTPFPLYYRPGSSDYAVFRQIFAEREYRYIDGLARPEVIIDCGANVGYSSAYFLSRFPDCSVIAVEPDPGNFELLRMNLEPYGRRARLLNAGVWSHSARLKLADTPFRDGRDWSRQVVECRGEEPGSIEAVGISELVRGSGFEWVSVLKMDIEGAEAVVFAANPDEWLERVDLLVIELHSDSALFGDARPVFAGALAGKPYRIWEEGELTFCRRDAATRAG